ncbi:MAG: hypothetical protein K4H23_04065 [Mollicutes bacterium PWAP]|nr:hypothetical protein [Mollicutes bacterium PWAP]
MNLIIQNSSNYNQFSKVKKITIINSTFKKVINKKQDLNTFFLVDSAKLEVINSENIKLEFYILDFFAKIEDKNLVVYGSFVDGMLLDDNEQNFIDDFFDKKQFKLLSKRSYYELNFDEFMKFQKLEIKKIIKELKNIK